jgi:hypothetical protein
MADSDKNIVITPFRGATSQPNIVFTGQGNDPITVRVLDGTTGTGLTSGGSLSFEGSAGQLFSIVNRLGTGSIFSVNDISGIPSIDVDASGRIIIAGFTGFVGIGLTGPTEKLHVTGNIRSSGSVNASGGVSSAGGTFAGIVNFLGGMCVASGITLTNTAGTRTHISQQGIRGAGFKIRNQVSFGMGQGDANEFDIGSSGGNITIAPTTSTVTIDTGLQSKTVDYQTGIRFLGYNSLLSSGYNTLLQVGFGSGNTLSLPSTSGTLALTNDVVTTFNGLTGQVTGVTTGTANTFGPLQSFTNGISASGSTFSGPVSSSGFILTSAGIKALTGTTYTFLASDNGDVITNNNISGCTFTVPSGLPVGFSTTIISLTAGAVRFVAASGVTMNSFGSFIALSGQHASASLISYASNIYNLSGNLS